MAITRPYTEVLAISETGVATFSALETALGNSETLDSVDYAFKVYDMGLNVEGNWFRVTANWTGSGTMSMRVASESSGALTLATIDNASRLQSATSLTKTVEVQFAKSWQMQTMRYQYLIFSVTGTVTDIDITCNIGKFTGTICGHDGPQFHNYAGINLPYQIMYPKDYDSDNATEYPLIFNTPGGGSEGSDGLVLLGTGGQTNWSLYGWTKWYHTSAYKAIYVIYQVPDIGDLDGVDAPYYPTGSQGLAYAGTTAGRFRKIPRYFKRKEYFTFFEIFIICDKLSRKQSYPLLCG